MAVIIGSARIDENGNAHGGKAGDQTGREVSTQNWYLHSKGWRVFRAKSAEAAERIARCMQAACDNRHVGYDQYERNTLYKAAEPLGFDVSRVTTDVETDCSALVRVCCAYAGILGLPADFRTGNMPKNLLGTGAFVEMTGSKYQSESAYLGRGDILVTKTSGHTVVVLSNGGKYEGSTGGAAAPIPATYALGDRILRYGCEGDDVRTMQEMLLKLGYDLGRWGVDGDFGDCTELALIAFQEAAGIDADGECGPITIDALDKALNIPTPPATSRAVKIVNGNCYVRTAPNTDGKKLGVVHNGDVLPYGGQTSEGGWNLVAYEGQNAWVSGKYSKVID